MPAGAFTSSLAAFHYFHFKSPEPHHRCRGRGLPIKTIKKKFFGAHGDTQLDFLS
jgi:hypothetical protein